jgi:xanthine dehydrogenase accessory factor
MRRERRRDRSPNGDRQRRADSLLHYGFTADQAFEVGLPCGGEIDVFLEPGPTDDSPEADIASDGTVLLTVLDGPQIGRKLLVRPGIGAVGGNATPTLAEVADRVRDSAVLEWHGQRVFAEIFRPAPRLVIVGAIDIAEALAALASSIGWRTICVDRGRRSRLGSASQAQTSSGSSGRIRRL